MRFLKFLPAILIPLFVMGCAASLPAPSTTAALEQAQAKVDQRLACPEPPAALLTCLDGTQPIQTPKGAYCPASVTLPAGTGKLPRAEVTRIAGAAIAWAWKEQGRRLDALAWHKQCHAPAQ